MTVCVAYCLWYLKEGDELRKDLCVYCVLCHMSGNSAGNSFQKGVPVGLFSARAFKRRNLILYGMLSYVGTAVCRAELWHGCCGYPSPGAYVLVKKWNMSLYRDRELQGPMPWCKIRLFCERYFLVRRMCCRNHFSVWRSNAFFFLSLEKRFLINPLKPSD